MTIAKTTVSVLTPLGRGAVATVRVCGELKALRQSAAEANVPFFNAKNGTHSEKLKLNRIVFGRWGEEELVACRTGEDRLEIHSHGGSLAVARIVENLVEAGAERIHWEDALALQSDAWLADYTTALTCCATERTAEILLQQMYQGKTFWNRLQKGEFSASELASAREWTRFGRHLIEPWEVVVGGPANVGKSSLINRLLGYQRAIVFDQPGTTRDVVSAETAIDGWPVRFSDTAGQRQTIDALETQGMAYAITRLQQADLQILVFDQNLEPDEFTLSLMQEFPNAILLYHKSDLPIHPEWNRIEFPETPLPVSSNTGAGIAELLKKISSRLVPRQPPDDVIFPISEKQRRFLNEKQ